MAISINDLKMARAVHPPRVILYGVQGVGKTTLAYEAPNPVFLQTEEGTPGDVEIATFGLLDHYDQVVEAIASLGQSDHDRKTLVIDTLDALEPLVWAKTCEVNGWQSIEDPGYGKGYIEADTQWRNLITACNWLRREKGMMIVQIAHCHAERYDDPVHGPYNKYTLNLHKRGSNLVRNEADMIGFMNYSLSVKEVDKGFNKTGQVAEGGGTRLMYWEERAGFVAKNRYGLPSQMVYKKGDTWPNSPTWRTMAAKLPGNVFAEDAADDNGPDVSQTNGEARNDELATDPAE